MKPKLSKAEQTAQTRTAILAQARHLFSTQGYAETATESLIAGLGITRGALYHQFKDKQAVFLAVIEQVFQEMAQHINTQAQTGATAWDSLVQGSLAYLEFVQADEIRRLVFIEAPAALGGETLTKLDRQYGFGLLLQSVQTLADGGEIETPNVEAFAMMINGALEQLAAWTAQTESSDRLETAKMLAKELLTLHRKV